MTLRGTLKWFIKIGMMIKTFKELSDECKWYEKNFSCETMIPHLPVIMRFDGNNFSGWTKKLNKPFDIRFISIMKSLTKRLMEETGADFGYTQSDEITLIFIPNHTGRHYYEGKKQKILSKLCSKCSIWFNELVSERIGDMKLAIFDLRIYQVPSIDIAEEQVLFRSIDCIRNSKQSFGHYNLGHSIMEGKSMPKVIELLDSKGLFWDNLDNEMKYGNFFSKERVSSKFTPEEIDLLPPKHDYFKNPNMLIDRTIIVSRGMVQLTQFTLHNFFYP